MFEFNGRALFNIFVRCILGYQKTRLLLEILRNMCTTMYNEKSGESVKKFYL